MHFTISSLSGNYPMIIGLLSVLLALIINVIVVSIISSNKSKRNNRISDLDNEWLIKLLIESQLEEIDEESIESLISQMSNETLYVMAKLLGENSDKDFHQNDLILFICTTIANESQFRLQ